MPYRLDRLITDSVRATQQASVVLNLLSGRGVRKNLRGGKTLPETGGSTTPNAATVRRHGATIVLGHLQATLPRFKVLHRDPELLGSGWKTPHVIGSGAGDAELEVVVSGVDGARDLVYGRDGGSMSLAAVGEAGTFVADPAKGAGDDFLIVVAGSEVPEKDFVTIFDTWKGGALNDALKDSAVVSRLATTVARTYRIEFPTLGTVLSVNDDSKNPDLSGAIPLLISRVTRGTVFCGSSVAAAIQVLRKARFGIDAFVAVVRRSHAALICAAAKALRGRVIAIPVTRHEEKSKKEQAHAGSRLLSAEDFVQGDRFALVGTGISESMLFRGVRYHPNEIVGVNSIVIDGASGQISDVRIRQRLSEFRFRSLRPNSDKTGAREPQDPQEFAEAMRMLRKYIGAPLYSRDEVHEDETSGLLIPTPSAADGTEDPPEQQAGPAPRAKKAGGAGKKATGARKRPRGAGEKGPKKS